MNIRTTQASALAQLQSGMFANFAKMTRAEEQISSGKRIVRPSDDPGAATRLLELKVHLAAVQRYKAALDSGGSLLDGASSTLLGATDLITQARSLLIQGSSGTMSPEDRHTIAIQLEQIRQRMIEVGNTKIDGRYVFGGTSTDEPPFESQVVGGVAHVRYTGSDDAAQVQIGSTSQLRTGVAGGQIFAQDERSGTQFTGSTGVAAGTSADQGSGYARLYVRHDATTATLGSGLALVNSGANDTVLGAHSLVVDSLAGTVQLDSGAAFAIPLAGAANLADFVVTDANGAELHLDFTGYTGVSSSTAVTGDGSISLDGANYTSLDFLDSNLELIDDTRGIVLHVDTRNIARSGVELVRFGGTVNAFDSLQGAIDDLNNVDGLDNDDLQERLGSWLDDIDRNHENMLDAVDELGALGAHASAVSEAMTDQATGLETTRAGIEDVDFGTAVLDMTRAQQSLQLVQAATARLFQTSLLDFLR